MPERKPVACKWNGCAEIAWAKQYCSRHYYTAQRHGLLSRPKCSVPDCSEPSFRKGMCNKHHLRQERYGDPLIVRKAANGACREQTCCIDGCGLPVKAKGMCTVHHGRLRHHGDPLATPKKLGNGQASEARKKENSKRAQQTYYAKPVGKLRRRFANARRRVLTGANSAHLDREQFMALWSQTHCALCGGHMTDDEKSVDHKIPLARGGNNDFENLQMAHLTCNQRKSDRLVEVHP